LLQNKYILQLTMKKKKKQLLFSMITFSPLFLKKNMEKISLNIFKKLICLIFLKNSYASKQIYFAIANEERKSNFYLMVIGLWHSCCLFYDLVYHYSSDDASGSCNHKVYYFTWFVGYCVMYCLSLFNLSFSKFQ